MELLSRWTFGWGLGDFAGVWVGFVSVWMHLEVFGSAPKPVQNGRKCATQGCSVQERPAGVPSTDSGERDHERAARTPLRVFVWRLSVPASGLPVWAKLWPGFG